MEKWTTFKKTEPENKFMKINIQNYKISLFTLLFALLVFKVNAQKSYFNNSKLIDSNLSSQQNKTVDTKCTIPGLSIIATQDTICSGTQTTLFANGATSYTWNPGNFIAPFFPVSPTVTTMYSVTATSGTCNATATLSIFVSALPAQPSSITGSTLAAVGHYLNYSVTPIPGAMSYSWS